MRLEYVFKSQIINVGYMSGSLIRLDHPIRLRTVIQMRLNIYLNQNLWDIEFIDHLALVLLKLNFFIKCET